MPATVTPMLTPEFQKIAHLRKRGGFIPVDTPIDFTPEDLERAKSHVRRQTPEFWDMMANEDQLPGNTPTACLVAAMIDYLP